MKYGIRVRKFGGNGNNKKKHKTHYNQARASERKRVLKKQNQENLKLEAEKLHVSIQELQRRKCLESKEILERQKQERAERIRLNEMNSRMHHRW